MPYTTINNTNTISSTTAGTGWFSGTHLTYIGGATAGITFCDNPGILTVKKKRKPRQPKVNTGIPTFTRGLETKLMKLLGQDATKMIHSLKKKINPNPVTEQDIDKTVYLFEQTYTMVSPTLGMLIPVKMIRQRTDFHLRLVIDLIDNKLIDYDFKLKSSIS